MKERIRRIFEVFGRFFRAIGRTLGRAGGWFKDNAAVVVGVAVSILLVALIVGVGIGMLHFMRSSDFYSGRVTELTFKNVEQRKALDVAAVENAQLKWDRDALLGENIKLLEAIQQLQAQMANMLRFEQVQWCDIRQDGKLVMPIELLPKEIRDVVSKTAAFARGISPDVEFAAVCVSVDEILISPLQGEMDFRVIRYYPNSDRDWLIVYWRQLPGSTEGELRTAEFYNVLTRERCRLDEVSQSWLCEKPER